MTTAPVELVLGDYLDALPADLAADAVIVHAPYSERVHGGHDSAPTVGGYRTERDPVYETGEGYVVYNPRERRRPLGYPAWTAADVEACVERLSPACRGWFVTITDHVLGRAWEASLQATGRYVFPPVPVVHYGGRVRLSGDGPSSWCEWLYAARPSSGTFGDGTRCNAWGTLRGAYEYRGRYSSPVVGAKPLGVMLEIVADYSRPGDLVVDPTAGGGTTLVAAGRLGRRALGAECVEATYETAAARIAREVPELAAWEAIRDRKLAERARAGTLREHDRARMRRIIEASRGVEQCRLFDDVS